MLKSPWGFPDTLEGYRFYVGCTGLGRAGHSARSTLSINSCNSSGISACAPTASPSLAEPDSSLLCGSASLSTQGQPVWAPPCTLVLALSSSDRIRSCPSAFLPSDFHQARFHHCIGHQPRCRDYTGQENALVELTPSPGRQKRGQGGVSVREKPGRWRTERGAWVGCSCRIWMSCEEGFLHRSCGPAVSKGVSEALPGRLRGAVGWARKQA